MLVLTLLILSFLSLLGGALITSTTLDIAIGDNYRTEVQLLNTAEGGIEEAREKLRLSPAAPSADVPVVSGEEPGRYSVFFLKEANGVRTLRSIAERGRARREIEVRLMKIGFPPLPAAITFADDPALDPRLRTQAGIERILKDIVRSADMRFDTGALGNVGNSEDYRVTVVNGDCQFGPGTGYGILIVRGVLTLNGNFRWNGLILAVGDGVVRAAPGAHGVIAGGVFLKVADFDPVDVVVELDRSQMDLSRYSFPYKAIAVREF